MWIRIACKGNTCGHLEARLMCHGINLFPSFLVGMLRKQQNTIFVGLLGVGNGSKVAVDRYAPTQSSWVGAGDTIMPSLLFSAKKEKTNWRWKTVCCIRVIIHFVYMLSVVVCLWVAYALTASISKERLKKLPWVPPEKLFTLSSWFSFSKDLYENRKILDSVPRGGGCVNLRPKPLSGVQNTRGGWLEPRV